MKTQRPTFRAKATLPAYAPTTREPDENGFRNIRNMPEHNDNVVAPGILQTYPPDNHSV